MKKIWKRILAAALCLAVAITGISVSDFGDTALAGNQGTISLTEGEVGYNKSTGFFLVSYTGIPSDYQNGIDFMDETFLAKYVTFEGGMTAEDVLTDKMFAGLATNTLFQVRWAEGTKSLKKGWKFTISKDAVIPYYTTGNETAYVGLDAEYTFEVKEGNAENDNCILVQKYKVATFTMDTSNPLANGLQDVQGQGTNINLIGADLKDYKQTYQYVHEDASYAEYIDFNGIKYSTLKDLGLKLRYIFDGGAKVMQIETWGQLRSKLQKGDQIIFKKGLPLYYQGTDGMKHKAVLEETYIFECVTPNADHNQVLAGVKYTGKKNGYGLATEEYNTFPQGEEVCINANFDADSTGQIATNTYQSVNLLGEYVANKYLDLAGYSVKEAREMGMEIRFIPTANVLQFAFGQEAVKKLEEGDVLLLKAGLPIVYENGTYVADSATLKESYRFIITKKEGTTLTIQSELTDSYALSGTVSDQKEEVGNYYYDLLFAEEMFADAKAEFQGTFDNVDSLLKEYVQVSGKSYQDLKNGQYELRRYNLPGVYVGLRLYCNAGKFDLKSNDTVIFKKGLPISYTTKANKKKTVTLDQDYGFRFNGTGFVYDSTISSGMPEEPVAPSTKIFALDTPQVSTWEEYPGQVTNIAVTGAPFNGTSGFYQNLTEETGDFLSFENCENAEVVKANTTLMLTVASAEVQVVQVKFNQTANSALQVGDRILLKKGLPVRTAAAADATQATLEDTYALRIVALEGQTVTVQVELTGTYQLTDVFYHAESYMDVRFASDKDLSDAVSFEDAKLPVEIRNTYLEIADHSKEDLQAQGYDMSVFAVPALRGIRISFTEFDLKANDILLLKKGLPITYTTTEGKCKTVYLDKTYGYVKNDQTAFVYDASITEIVKPTYLNFGLVNEILSFVDGDQITKFNIGIKEGIIASQDVMVSLLEDEATEPYVAVEGYTTQQLKNAGVVFRFYPKAGVIQMDPGHGKKLSDFTKVTFKKGMTISYYDAGPKKATLTEEYQYQIVDHLNGTYTLERTGIEIPVEAFDILLSGTGSTFVEAGATKVNLPLEGGSIPTNGYVAVNVMADAAARDYVSIPGYTTKQLIDKGFQMVYIPSAGFMQLVLGQVQLKSGMEIVFKKGMPITYMDGNDKKCATLKQNCYYKVTKENGVFVMTKIHDFQVKITVDGVVKVSGSYKEGTKLDLSKYANKKKGKVMSIQVNGTPMQNQTFVVTEPANIVIRNRSDICIVVFKDGKTTVCVKEYQVNTKSVKLPYAPDQDGYDDTWEAFELVNGVVTVQAVHTKKQTEPTISLKGVSQTDVSETPKEEEVTTSPKTGDTGAASWPLLAGAIAIALAMAAVWKKRHLARD